MEANEIKTMRFGVLTQKGHAEVRERPLPEMGPEEVLVEAAGLQYLYYGLPAVAGSAGRPGLPHGQRT